MTALRTCPVSTPYIQLPLRTLPLAFDDVIIAHVVGYTVYGPVYLLLVHGGGDDAAVSAINHVQETQCLPTAAGGALSAAAKVKVVTSAYSMMTTKLNANSSTGLRYHGRYANTSMEV